MCGYTRLTEKILDFKDIAVLGSHSRARVSRVKRSGVVSPISKCPGFCTNLSQSANGLSQELFNAGQKCKIVNLGIPISR